MREAHQVVVVGAGPAGAAVSWFLAERGLDVLLVDRGAWPRSKTCGDCLSPRALAMLAKLGLLEQVAQQGQCIRRAALFAPGGRRVAADIPASPGGVDYLVVIPRLLLDDIVRRQAVAAGAAFRSQWRVRELIEDDGRVAGVRGETPDGPVEVRARMVILAAGAALGFLFRAGMIDRRPALGLAARTYFEGVSGPADEVEFHFDATPLPGYTWLFPTGPRTANVGAGYFGRRGVTGDLPVRKIFERALSSSRLAQRLAGARPSEPVRSHPLHFGFGAARLARPGLLLIGESAGLINPLSGEGIELALESAETAAEALVACIAAGAAPERIAERCAAALLARFRRSHRTVSRVRDFYLRRWILDRLAAAAEKRDELRRMLVEVALGATDPALTLHPRVITRVLLG